MGGGAGLLALSEQTCRCLKRERWVRKRSKQFSHLRGRGGSVSGGAPLRIILPPNPTPPHPRVCR